MQLTWSPEAHSPTSDLDDSQLAEIYAYPEEQLPWLRANMVASLDGAATVGGQSRPLSSDADRRLLGVLRALADVVIVGAETARVENYRPPTVRESLVSARRARGQADSARLALVSSRLDLDPGADMFHGQTRALVLTHAFAPEDRQRAISEVADVMVVGHTQINWRSALTELAGQGLSRQLCEGGPHLLGQLVSQRLVDDVALTISPTLAGPGATRIVAGELGHESAARMALASTIVADGTLFLRYVRTP